MKLHRLLILSGLLIGAAPVMSFAECRPACTGTDVCRITAQGPPTVYGCMAPPAKKDIRSPGGIQQPGGGVAKGGSPVGSTARTSGPKEQKQANIQSPRDVASGQATGRRQHTP